MAYISKEIHRDGTSQIKRISDALLPDYVKIEARSLEDNLEYIYKLAKQIVYYDLNNKAAGSWQDFFSDFDNYEKIRRALRTYQKNSSAEPHLALIITFLHLLKYAIKDLNKLTDKHIDFFYNKVLRIDRKGVKPDLVHVIFELSKNVNSCKLDKGTLLDAGNQVQYELTKEIVLNKAAIKSLRSIYVEKKQDHKLYAAPVSNSSDGIGSEFDDENTEWKAFGESQLEYSDDELTMQTADVGFAVSSPLLYLQEGDRTIKLKIPCRTLIDHEEGLLNDLKVFITGEKEWMECIWKSGELIMTGETEEIDSKVEYYYGVLNIEVGLSVDSPSTASFDKKIHTGGLNSKWPVLKFILNQESIKFAYETLKDIEFNKIHLTVTVDGLKTLRLNNDNSKLDPAKPFLPFGATPRKNSSFIISSDELAKKNIDNAKLSIQWDNLPNALLGNHYADYPGNITNGSFRTNISISKKGSWESPFAKPENLFNLTNAELQRDIVIDSGFDTSIQDNSKVSADNNSIKLELAELYNVSTGIKISEVNAFGHQEFPNLYTNAAVFKAQQKTESDIQAIDFPNKPYTPIIKELSLYYESSGSLFLDPLKQTSQFFRIEPFGYLEVSTTSEYIGLLEKFEEEGNFYIGLENLDPPQNVSILFHLAEGSGKVDPNSSIDPISFSYLSENGWQAFSSEEIITETTLNLQKSGIIEFALGRDAVKGSTKFIDGKDLFWIKLSIESRPDEICKLIKLHTNAAISQLVEESRSDGNIVILDPDSITKLLVKKGEVKKVSQPYSSFDGRSKEVDKAYYSRVSERIRHKNRDISHWDYERMVLEEFPQVYKVKCLNHADALSDIAPGSITLLIISNLRNKNASNPLEPTTSYGTLLEIKNLISKYVSPFVQINVENPKYEQLLVDFKVGFHEGYDAGYYSFILNEELKKFLSPWAYAQGKDIIFGGKVYRSEILMFVEALPYVDYVTEFKLYHIYDSPSKTGIDYMQIEKDFIVRDYTGKGISEMEIGSTFIIGYESEIASASNPRSILVSAPEHRIQVLKAGEYVCEGIEYKGIGKMAIEINFDVEK